mgnify:CR=1 FL=1
MSKGSKYRVTWCRTYAEKLNKIFSTEIDISDLKLTDNDIKEDLDYKGGCCNTERKKCGCKRKD